MCGIVGFLAKKTDFDFCEALNGMTDKLSHRGPDDRGIYTSKLLGDTAVIGLGHRRLSIIDLSSHSHQPMIDGAVSIVFNGEIYNHIELRRELQSLGQTFESSGDTEVILRAYKVWGIDCFSRFNGMWAIAIFDQTNKKLVLSRDRLGKKPLYYFIDSEKIVFGSEIKSLLLYPDIPKKPNFKKIYRYISTSYRYIDTDNTSYFEGIHLVQRGSNMVVSEDLSVSKHEYWNLKENMISLNNKSEKVLIDDFRDLFIDSVKIRLRSDVPVGCMLSGGLDSTSVMCVAHKILKTPIMAFSGITGEDKGIYDESEYIDEMVRDTGAVHKYIMPEPSDLFSTISEMLFYHDEPICTISWYALFLIAKQIKIDNVPVVLNGHGGDELLGGYWYHYQYNFYDLLRDGDLEKLDYEQKAWLFNHDRKVMEICSSISSIESMDSGQKAEYLQYSDYSDVFSSDFRSMYTNSISLDSSFKTSLSKRLHKELLHETVPASLKAEDRNTMASSIESRSPMLDYRLAEFCFSLPNNYKIRDGMGKWILREAMRGILPEKIRSRKDKAGFIVPADRWFRTTNKEQIRELINSENIKSLGIFDIARLNDIFDEHINGFKNHQMFLWQFINFALWYKTFFGVAK